MFIYRVREKRSVYDLYYVEDLDVGMGGCCYLALIGARCGATNQIG
jgi:hypothetical protein